MNTENIRTLVDRLRTLEHTPVAKTHSVRYFNMAVELFPCGSPACVSGHCRRLFYGPLNPMYKATYGSRVLEDCLGLSYDDAWDLYKAKCFKEDIDDITPQRVADYLEERYL